MYQLKGFGGVMSKIRGSQYESPILDVQLEPHKQEEFPLGTGEEKINGFAVELLAESGQPDSVVAQVIDTGVADVHNFVLRIANFSVNEITAKVWKV